MYPAGGSAEALQLALGLLWPLGGHHGGPGPDVAGWEWPAEPLWRAFPAIWFTLNRLFDLYFQNLLRRLFFPLSDWPAGRLADQGKRIRPDPDVAWSTS